METELKGKWKEFAIGELFYEWTPCCMCGGHKTADQLYDLLVSAQGKGQSDLIEVFNGYDIKVWGPFICWEYFDVVDYMKALARKAQEVEAQP